MWESVLAALQKKVRRLLRFPPVQFEIEQHADFIFSIVLPRQKIIDNGMVLCLDAGIDRRMVNEV